MREIYQRITGQRDVIKQEEQFQKSCGELARLIFLTLREYDPWCIHVTFEGHLFFTQNSPDITGYINASIWDITTGRSAPYIDFHSFEIYIPSTKGVSPEEIIRLSKWYGSGMVSDKTRPMSWDLNTQTIGVGKTWPYITRERDPLVVSQISESLQKCHFKPTKR